MPTSVSALKYLPFLHKAMRTKLRNKYTKIRPREFLKVGKEPSMPKEIKNKEPEHINMTKIFNIKPGDLVQVLYGRDAGKHGVIRHVLWQKNQVIVTGCNMVRSFWRPLPSNLMKRDVLPKGAKKPSNIVTVEAPIHITNVAPVDPVTKRPTRIKRRYSMFGECVRISKVSMCAMPEPITSEEQECEGDKLYKLAKAQQKEILKGAPMREKYATRDKKHYEMLLRVANRLRVPPGSRWGRVRQSEEDPHTDYVFDGDPIFNSLLNNDSEESGFFDVVLQGQVRSEQKYIPNTAILVTTLSSRNNDVVQIKDFAPKFVHYDRMFRPFQLFRVITRIRGDPMITVRVRPTFNYNSTDGYQTRGSHHIRFCGPTDTWRMTSNASIRTIIEEVPFLVHDPVYIVFGQDESFANSLTQVCKEFEDKTLKYWKQWCMNLVLPVDYQDILARSAITLSLLQSDECGGLVTSFTTGIPLGPSSPPTRDERACHLLDICMSLQVLRQFGLFTMVRRFLEYVKNLCYSSGMNVQPVYSLIGDSDVPAERVIYLAGYQGVGEVVVGGIGDNGAGRPNPSGDASMNVNDPNIPMYGLFCVALAHGFFDVRLKDICSPKVFDRLEKFGTKAVEAFQMFVTYTHAPPPPPGEEKPNYGDSRSNGLYFDDDLRLLTLAEDDNDDSGGYSGIDGADREWVNQQSLNDDSRDSYGRPRVHTFTAVLCWAACDRLQRVAEHLHWVEKSKMWGAYARHLLNEIWKHAWNRKRQALTAYWGGERVGPSILRLAEIGFVSSTDWRFASSVVAFEQDAPLYCCSKGAMQNPKQDNKRATPHELGNALLSSPSATYLTSTLLWYAEALRSIGRENDARTIFHSLCAASTECGLLSESVDLQNCTLWDILSRILGYLDLAALPDISILSSHFRDAVSRRLQFLDSAALIKAAVSHPAVCGQATNCKLHFCHDNLSSVIAEMNLENLKHLDLSACQWLDDAAVTGLAHHTGNLEHLDLYWSAAITSDTALCHLMRANRGLRYLSLSGVKATTDRVVMAACAQPGRAPLETFDLTRCPKISDASLMAIGASYGSSLKVLRLYATTQFSDDGYKALEDLEKLEVLDLCGHINLTSATAVAFLERMPNLKHLNLTWCKQMDDSVLETIGKCNKKLHWLSVFGAKDITKRGLDAITGLALTHCDLRGIPNLAEYTCDDCKGLKEMFPKLKEWILFS
ncbi:hypothetical protein FOL47_008886 [Perkinsus chesapeaki]|uniref:Large ribosomal subunit protein uL24 C-terminal domain-containing protein n=1 Tax=Perkinsus chesapeaki TaxID=330153 RepID=A0A7J6LBF4_PERCH|nr:hypothetical protein FOL47_008886 [Perkinsus chesapeaki]